MVLIFADVRSVEEEGGQPNVPPYVPLRIHDSHLLVLVAGVPCVEEEGRQHNIPPFVPPRVNGSHNLD